jgi:hypothetical protein
MVSRGMDLFDFSGAEEIPRKKWYRVDYITSIDGTKLTIETAPVVKETPKGAWVGFSYDTGKPFFCLKGSGKRQYHETFELAVESFLSRKTRQLRILNTQISAIEMAIRLARSEHITRKAKEHGIDYIPPGAGRDL